MLKITMMSFKNVAVVLLLIFVSISCAEQPAVEEQTANEEQANEVEGSSVDDKVNSMNESENSGANTDFSSSNNAMNAESLGIETVYFGFDKFDLNSENMNITTSNADKLSNNNTINVKLEGNCDEWGSDEYNYALGLKRAKSVKDNLVANGIDDSRISIVSYGESNAVCSEKNKACWAQNRRVETKFLP